MKKVFLMFVVTASIVSFSSCKKDFYYCTCYTAGGGVLWEADVEATSVKNAEHIITKNGGDCEGQTAECTQD
jgi:hypothetical protein